MPRLKPELYPVTIANTRYGGTYEGGAWAAWHLDPDQLPEAWNDDDSECQEYWASEEAKTVGRGPTPLAALDDLHRRVEHNVVRGLPVSHGRVESPYAQHTIPVYAQGERCRCDQPATHKIGEESSSGAVHNMTAYVCCACFQRVIGDCTQYPYDLKPHRFIADFLSAQADATRLETLHHAHTNEDTVTTQTEAAVRRITLALRDVAFDIGPNTRQHIINGQTTIKLSGGERDTIARIAVATLGDHQP